MILNVFFAGVIILMVFAVFDLMVGVSNDAANFLNSSIGSKVAPRYVIMIIASLGIVVGVSFSSGMMEIARKGIFNPQFFTMPELLMIFLAVMITDIILLDVFNTFGLPTSTTVSIVFELLGAAVAASVVKEIYLHGSIVSIGEYINSSKAMMIIMGILLSVVVAFVCGMIAQFLTRLLFTFDYMKRIRRYGATWGGVALSSITFFILIKGAKGASFITPETLSWIKSNSGMILLWIFIISSVVLQLLIWIFNTNILKIIILAGTFALALAFAANDLVNFIGVPMAGMHAYKAAIASSNPLSITMGVLSQKVHSETYLLLIAGFIMVITLWFSKKARTVSDTEISLGQQEEGLESFESTALSRIVVRIIKIFFDNFKVIVPKFIRSFVDNRINPENYSKEIKSEENSFDLIRASVNLMVASAVVSLATSMKLPLSTTYVTFMVAMGTSFSDRAWGRESAVYRVAGVMTVIGGWFMTAVMAFLISAFFLVIISYLKAYGVILLLFLVIAVVWKTHRRHKAKIKIKSEQDVFNLKKITDPSKSLSMTFEHIAIMLSEIRQSIDKALEALFIEDLDTLRKQRKGIKKIQLWSNIIIANVFKVLRLIQQKDSDKTHKYAQTVRRLQKISDGHRDLILRSYSHISNNHKGLLDEQIEELRTIKKLLFEILKEAEEIFSNKKISNNEMVIQKLSELRSLAEKTNVEQTKRIKEEKSKTRLSILYYAIIGNAIMLSKQNVKLIEIFQDSFEDSEEIYFF